MKTCSVKEIMHPCGGEVPSYPRISVDDRITYAIEQMIQWEVKFIAVVRNNRTIGIIRLQDALEKVGVDNNP